MFGMLEEIKLGEGNKNVLRCKLVCRCHLAETLFSTGRQAAMPPRTISATRHLLKISIAHAQIFNFWGFWLRSEIDRILYLFLQGSPASNAL